MNNQTRSGALYPLSCSNVLIDSCFFKDNHNDFTNGGALFSGQNKNVLISNCNFIQNSASNGGAIDIDGRNIPIDSLSLTRIENCRFEGNTSVNRGSAIYCNANPDILIRRCVFIDNAADIGGAVTIQQPELNATDTTRVRIDSCRFRNNSTTNQDFGGGALFLFQTAAKIENCNFESNFSNGLTFSAGGHILAYGPQRHFIFRADTLSNGISHGYGGAVTTLGPGAQYFFENCLFKENESDQFGGAIYNALAATTILKDCTFQENKSLGNSGGAIALQDDSSRLVVQRSVFRQNSAGIHGGSIYTDGGSNTVDIDQSLFESNEAGASGGAIYMSERAGSEGSKLTLSNSWLGFNFSVAEGGAISNKDVDAQIVSSVIYQNSCSGSGLGGTLVLIASGQDTMLTEITNATIVDNHGGLADGLVQYSLSFDTSNIAYIKNCIFRNRGTTNYYKEIGVPILESRGGNMSDDSSLLEVLTHKKDLNLTEPIFTDTITNDYSLESISPGIDDGVEENAPEFDILGLPRVNAPDMGAYENQFPVNVKEIIPSKVEDIIVSPNPASGKSAEIIMNNSWIGSMELRIISLSGAVMKMQKVYKPAEIYRFIISLDGLSPAVYQVIVSNGEEVRLKKLIRI